MRQRWGQNFLVDSSVARRMVEALPEAAGMVLEIGPGKGVLTQFLVEKCPRLTVVEIDRDLAENLRARWPFLDVVVSDFLDWELSEWGERTTRMIGNLPYSSANAILRKLLGWTSLDSAVFMVQKEVADRIMASAGTPDYGLLTLAVQGKSIVERLFDVDPACFQPRPQVVSTVLRLKRLAVSRFQNEKRFFRVARAAFSQRRKMLLNGLAHGLRMEKKELARWLEVLDIDPQCRGEILTLDDFNRLSQKIPLDEAD